MALEALRTLRAEEAAPLLKRCAELGPDDAETLARSGVAVAVQLTNGVGVMVLQRVGSTLWVAAAQGPAIAESFADVGLPLVEDIARRIGCTRVGFMTRRPGLVRKATRAGWRAELTKELA